MRARREAPVCELGLGWACKRGLIRWYADRSFVARSRSGLEVDPVIPVWIGKAPRRKCPANGVARDNDSDHGRRAADALEPR